MDNAKSNVTVEIDKDVKETAISLLGQMGLDETTAIELFYRQIIAERRLPFQPIAAVSLKDQIVDIIKKMNIPSYRLEADENGRLIIDENCPANIRDWVENG